MIKNNNTQLYKNVELIHELLVKAYSTSAWEECRAYIASLMDEYVTYNPNWTTTEDGKLLCSVKLELEKHANLSKFRIHLEDVLFTENMKNVKEEITRRGLREVAPIPFSKTYHV